MFYSLTNTMSFETIQAKLTNKEQKANLLKAKIAVALHDEPGRVPKKEEIEQVFLLTRVIRQCLGCTPNARNRSRSGNGPIF